MKPPRKIKRSPTLDCKVAKDLPSGPLLDS